MGAVIRGVHHVAVSTGDLERLKRFYTEVLGFEVVAEWSWSGNRVIVGLEGSAADTAMLRAGNVYLEMFQYHSPEGAPGRPACDHGYTSRPGSFGGPALFVEGLLAAQQCPHEPLQGAGVGHHLHPAPQG